MNLILLNVIRIQKVCSFHFFKFDHMTKRIFSILFCCFLLGTTSQNEMFAAHIVGGDVTYECLGLDTTATGEIFVNLRIEFNIYKGPNGAVFNNPAEFGLFRFDGTNYTHLNTYNEGIDDQGFVPIDFDNPCIDYPQNVSVERATYVYDLDPLPLLTGSNESYVLAWQRCCRNNTITNIVAPGDTGAAFLIEITSLGMSICNDSPKYNNFPPVFICAGQELNFDHGATDNQGHQVFYEFCAPLTAGGQDGGTMGGNANSCTGVTPDPSACPPPFDEVTFKLPNFTATNPLNGSPVVTINSQTGLITGTPTVNGQYVVGVCAREVFNGQIMSVIRRDFQFNVTTCEVAVTADIDPQGNAVVEIVEEVVNGQTVQVETITSCGEDEIMFTHMGPTEDIETYYWEAQINGNIETANTQSTSFNFPGPGNYGVLLITNEGLLCEARDSFPVLIYPDLIADFQFDYDTCDAGDVFFEDLSIATANDQTLTDWNWDFAGFGSSSEEDPSFRFPQPGAHLVSLTITDDNNCRNTIEQEINWFPVPPILFVEPSSFVGCAPADIFFNNLSSPIDTTYDITWDFGDGEFGSDISPTHTYTEVGNYSVSLEVISPIGCATDTTFTGLIQIVEKPIADFSFSPDEPNVFNTTVDFFDNSTDAISWQWDFSGESSSLIENPTYTFRDTGLYVVSLIVRHESGCTDTTQRLIDIEPIVRFHMPNAFTPNGDATNDILIGNGYYDGMTDFVYTVWNRWGEKIFESNDPYVGWNGRKDNSGQESPAGVYVYDINFVDPRGKAQNLRGHATLIR